MTPGQLRLVVQRWTPFVYRIAFPGYDLSDATVTVQVRLLKDSPFSELDLTTVSNPLAEGITIAGAMTDGLPTSTVQLRINETSIEQLLPYPSGYEADTPVELVWAMHITLSPVGKRRWLEGPFIINPGANHA